MESLHASNWVLLAGAAIMLLGIASSLIATRFGAPLLLVFLVLGMLLGEEGPGGVQFADYQLTFTLGSLALALILFDGGLRTHVSRMKGVLAPATLLATVGVLITSGLTACAAVLILEFDWAQGMLLGAIVASTDAAAVFFLLRANGLHLQQRVGSTLEIESGSNDPAAVLMTLVLTGWMTNQGSMGVAALAGHLIVQFGLGAALGALGGQAIAYSLNRLALPAGLHPMLTAAGAVALFAFTNVVGGSGFLAAYIGGLVVGNRPVRAFANVLSVQDAVTWLAQLVMFLLLGLLVSPLALLEVLIPALGIAAFLMLVGRPIAAMLCLLPFGYRKREIAFVSWVGLRGAVGIFLASIPMLADLPSAEVYFNVAFVVVFVSLLVQGWTIGPAAFLFKVAVPRRDPPSRRIELDLPGQLEFEMVGYRVAADSAVLRGRRPPGWARAALVVRHQQVFTPEQAGLLEADDYAYYLAPLGRVNRLDWLFAEADEAQEAERELFGTFTLAADVPLGALAEFYGLKVPPRLTQRTAADLFAQRFDGAAQVGDRLNIGEATLVVRDINDDGVAQVGMKFGSVEQALFGQGASGSDRPHRWRLWRGKRSS